MKQMATGLMMLVLVTAAAAATETMEDPAKCAQCRMSRAMLPQARMLIGYADGSTSGVCSVHCLIPELNQNKAKQVQSLQVADYTTSKLTDATNAVWVVGGRKKGGMNSPPKWAFAEKKDAEAFVKENGGELSGYETILPRFGQNLSAPSGTNAPPSAAKEDFPALAKPGKKIPLGENHYFTYGFDKPPKLGMSVMRVEIFANDGKPDTSFRVVGSADMPSMRGAHDSGEKDFALSNKGIYLLPVRIVMPGDWEVRFTFVKEGKTVLRGTYVFDM